MLQVQVPGPVLHGSFRAVLWILFDSDHCGSFIPHAFLPRVRKVATWRCETILQSSFLKKDSSPNKTN